MQIFPGLPNDLGRKCLLRVSYESHPNLRAVCRSWEATLNGPRFYQDRKTLGTTQQCICLFELHPSETEEFDEEYVVTVYNPLQGTWEPLPPFPHFPGVHYRGIPIDCACISLNQKLLLIGGRVPSPFPSYGNVLSNGRVVNTVFIYNFSTAQWSRGADMPTVRMQSAVSVSPEGLVYVVGGKGSDLNALRRAEVYSVEEDEWMILPDMGQDMDNCFGAFNDGKLFVFDEEPYRDLDLVAEGLNGEVYDPKRGAWTTIRDEEPPPVFNCEIASTHGPRFFSVEESGVMEYDSKENVWRAVCSIPERLAITIRNISVCVVWRDMIFVGGVLPNDEQLFYMWKPPPIQSEEGAQGETFGKWYAIEKPQHFHVDYVHNLDMFAVTVEI